MTQETGKKSKRLDLQGIRGLAILSVLGFHFYPNYFPNGYLGVDQFFVLSGFLMCMLLKRSENMPIFSLITLFYSKRFKRILPLYLLLICCSLIALYVVFPDTAIETNTQSASKAIIFISNRPKTEQEDYFQMLSIAVDIFTHTWSLSVEVQFYFIVPLIFIIANRFGYKYQLIFYVSIGILSFLFYSLSNGVQAFNNVFARVWQFIIGMIVYVISSGTASIQNNIKLYTALKQDEEVGLIGEEEDEVFETDTKNGKIYSVIHSQIFKYVLLVVMIDITLYPLIIPVIFARPFITLSTGILMSISSDDYFLSNKLLTYFGDISYSLYLIHWPVYAYWKLTFNNNQYLLLFSLLASVLLAVLIFETFEKWYLQLSSISVGVLVIFLLIPNVVLINFEEIRKHFDTQIYDFKRLDGVTPNMTFDDAQRLNRRWSVDDDKNNLAPTCDYKFEKDLFKWCFHTGLDKQSKYKIMTIGNSWVGNHATLFYQECHQKAHTILQTASRGCEPLYPSDKSARCRSNIIQFEKRVTDAKPDYAFIFTRFISQGDPFPKNVTKMQDDPIYQFMKNQTMKMLKNIKKKLYILNAIPRVNGGQIGNIVKNLKANKSLVEIDKGLVNLSSYKMARARQDELIKDCGGRCESIDYFNELYNNSTNTFRYYDEKGFSYFTSANHMSLHGLEKVRHIYHNICKNL